MKVLVTGANGFLGAWIVKRLLQEGLETSALVRKTSDLTELSKIKTNFVYGDISDKASLLNAFKGHEAVFHAAGLVSYKKSDLNLLNKINVEGTRNVIESCIETGIESLLHVSSIVAIGASFDKSVLTEDSPYNIGHLKLGYFDTKRAGEQLVIAAAREKKIRAVCVNPSTIYGAGDARKGSRSNQIKVAKGRLPFYTNGGVNVVAVEDVVDGIISAFKKGRSGERYVLANENYTIKELFQKIADCAGVKAPSVCMPNWVLHGLGLTGDLLRSLNVEIGLSQTTSYTATMYHWFSSKRAQIELGFKPTSSDLAIERSVRWMKENGYLNE